MPSNGADPTNVLAALYRDLEPEQVVFLQIHCDARSAWQGEDDWLLIQQVLARPSVYDAFGISSLPPHIPFHTARGLEVIGTVANLLDRGGVHRKFVDDFEAALAESRGFLDNFFRRDYRCAMAYSSRGAWCDWFYGDGILDETVLVRNGPDWWLLAITATD